MRTLCIFVVSTGLVVFLGCSRSQECQPAISHKAIPYSDPVAFRDKLVAFIDAVNSVDSELASMKPVKPYQLTEIKDVAGSLCAAFGKPESWPGVVTEAQQAFLTDLTVDVDRERLCQMTIVFLKSLFQELLNQEVKEKRKEHISFLQEGVKIFGSSETRTLVDAERAIHALVGRD